MKNTPISEEYLSMIYHMRQSRQIEEYEGWMKNWFIELGELTVGGVIDMYADESIQSLTKDSLDAQRIAGLEKAEAIVIQEMIKKGDEMSWGEAIMVSAKVGNELCGNRCKPIKKVYDKTQITGHLIKGVILTGLTIKNEIKFKEDFNEAQKHAKQEFQIDLNQSIVGKDIKKIGEWTNIHPS